MKYHKWIGVGREWDSPVVNIWQCKHCDNFKALDEPGRGQRRVEYSTLEGEVLHCGGSGPPCERRNEC